MARRISAVLAVAWSGWVSERWPSAHAPLPPPLVGVLCLMAIELFSPSCVGAGKWIFQATKELASSALTQRLLSSLDLGSRLHVFAPSAVFRASWLTSGSGVSPYRPKTAFRREVVRRVDLGTSINTTRRALHCEQIPLVPVTGTVTQISSRTQSFILRAPRCSGRAGARRCCRRGGPRSRTRRRPRSR